jgi:PTS system glucitol/sorbitol-specific IIA component
MIKYETTVSSVGEMVAEFVQEGVLVFFGDQAPEELHDIAALTTEAELVAPVAPGDVLELNGASFQVTAVGDVANENIGQLGHLVVKFNGLDEPEMPGDVSVTPGEVPDIQPGTRVRITSQER